MYYNFSRTHSSLKKELKVKTPYDAIKEWHQLEPDIFIKTPDEFKNMAFVKLHNNKNHENLEQRGET